MKTIRDHIEGFAYPFLEYVLDLIDREGENAILGDYKCTIDEGGFALGTLIKCSVTLYLNEKDPKKAVLLRERLLRFFDMIDEDRHIGTWGKQFLLQSLVSLKDAGKDDLLSKEKLDLIARKTDYGDFFDKEKVEIPKDSTLPTNYYHVALTCALCREQLGFEDDGMADKIAEKFLSIMNANSCEGWMDEVPPRGRFDSYSLNSYRSTSLPLLAAGKNVPDFIYEKAKEASLINFSMRNRHGYGFMYGRSLSVYGDSGTLSQIIFGLKNGFIEEKDKDEAIAYCIAICDRLVNFWYRKDKNFFDIWTDSRATDCYRGPEVVLNLNLEMTISLISVLEYFTSVGLDNYIPEKNVSEPEKWEARKTVFIDEPQKARALYVLRRGKHTFSLPFIGMAKTPNTVNDAYFAFPHEQEFIEEPVWRYHPFLVPEITTEDGNVAVLMEGFRSIEEKYEDDKVTIKVSGYLVGTDTVATDIGFDGTYIFDGDKIKVEFNIHKPYKSARMLYSGAKTDHVRFIGVVSEEITDVSEKKEFRACSGGIKECKTAYFTDKIGYEITL